MATTLKDRYKAATNDARERGGRAEDAYVKRATSFDPYAAAETSARGQFNSFREMLQQDLGDLRGQQVGMGRLNTGFATEGEDRLIGSSLDRLNNQIMSNANNAARMDMQNFTNLGGYGERKTGSFYDLLSGGLDRERAEENARDAQRANLGGGIGALLGGVAGSIIPGAGTVVGAGMGGALGKALGGLF